MKRSRKYQRPNTYYRLVAAIAVVLTMAVMWLLSSNHAEISNKKQVKLSPAQIDGLKAIGQWEFLSVSDEEIADTVRTGFFSDDELVRIYRGTLRLGIDMADVKEGWIGSEGDTIVLTLPAVRLLDEDFLDEANARSFYETGTWSRQARQDLAEKARRKMKKRCLTPSNIVSAEKNATAQFNQMLRSMGFENVRIRFAKGR